LWAALETLHDVTYFADAVRPAGIELGLKGFWMTYFAWRAAPLGPVPAAPVVAMFAGFHPGAVARALPESWSRTTPQACLEARTAVSTAALSDAGVDPEACGRAAAMLAPVAAAVDPTGRPLGAANAALEQEVLQRARIGWTDEDWTGAAGALRGRGLLTAGPGLALTPSGRALLDSVEASTDERAWSGGLAALGEHGVEEVLALLRPSVRAVATSGMLPEINPTGLRNSG
jgi:hypothetical protein